MKSNMRKLNIILGCEESQIVCKEFRKQGHNAFSCDLQDHSGGHPEWHFKNDIFDILENYNINWDFMGFHPDCTYLTNSGVTWLFNEDGTKNIQRWINLEKAIKFFNKLKSYINIGYLENPIPHKYARDGFYSIINNKWVKGIGIYQQLIQPYQFGHLERKATCLWLKKLPPLKHTKNVRKEMEKLPKNISQRIHYLGPHPERAKIRSKTYTGIAKAMAKQWGGNYLKPLF